MMMQYERAENVFEWVDATPVTVNRREYFRFVGADGKVRLVSKSNPLLREAKDAMAK